MAKGEKAKVRVFFGEIEGDNETVQDALRSIAAAVNKTFQPNIAAMRLPAVGDQSDKNGEHVTVGEGIMQTPYDDVEEVDGFQPTQSKAAKQTSKRSKKGPTYQHVKDLDLRPEGKTSLRDFFNEKRPREQQEKIVVVLYYLHRVLEMDGVTIHHVFSGLKDVGQRVPNDIAQTLRNIASRKGWVDSSDTSNLKTTVSGDNFVEHDLPNSAGQNGEA